LALVCYTQCSLLANNSLSHSTEYYYSTQFKKRMRKIAQSWTLVEGAQRVSSIAAVYRPQTALQSTIRAPSEKRKYQIL
jgi:hypothetical protein